MSTKLPVSWHIKNLENRKCSIERRRAQMQREMDDLARDEAEFEFAKYQIAEAQRRGKTEFDSDRFCMKRRGGRKLVSGICHGCANTLGLYEVNGIINCPVCNRHWVRK